MTAINANQFAVSLTLEGVRITGLWEQKTGGLADSNTSTYMPGGMAPQKAVSGMATVAELTLVRVYDLERDEGGGVVDRLLAARGHGVCKAKQVSLDANGNVFGNGLVWTGILKSVQTPDFDAASTSQAMLTVVITTDGNVARAT